MDAAITIPNRVSAADSLRSKSLLSVLERSPVRQVKSNFLLVWNQINIFSFPLTNNQIVSFGLEDSTIINSKISS